MGEEEETNQTEDKNMNEIKPKIKQKLASQTAEKRPRTIDPGIEAIHREACAKVAAYRRVQQSHKLFNTIITKRLSQLTQSDRERLMDALSASVSPALIPPAKSPEEGLT